MRPRPRRPVSKELDALMAAARADERRRVLAEVQAQGYRRVQDPRAYRLAIADRIERWGYVTAARQVRAEAEALPQT
jgi:predicted signal transduction protein with EAL and GGDEF domain